MQPNWIIEEHDIKIGIIMDVQENVDWYKEPHLTQLELLVDILYEMEQEKIRQTNEFAILKEIPPQITQDTQNINASS